MTYPLYIDIYLFENNIRTDMYDEILFPTDGSPASEATFEHAVAMTRAFDARIHVLYVVNTTYAGVGTAGSININSLRESGKSVLADVRKRLSDSDIEVVTELGEGDPFAEIVDYSNDHCDLIVMGTRGRSGLDKYLLGSVTEKVVRSADVPVVTVRTGETD